MVFVYDLYGVIHVVRHIHIHVGMTIPQFEYSEIPTRSTHFDTVAVNFVCIDNNFEPAVPSQYHSSWLVYHYSVDVIPGALDSCESHPLMYHPVDPCSRRPHARHHHYCHESHHSLDHSLLHESWYEIHHKQSPYDIDRQTRDHPQ